MTKSRVVLASALALAATALGVTATPATPATASSSLQYWTGTVTKVSDGDTIWVDIAGDGTSKSFEVRNAGIQATEIQHTSLGIMKDECHSREAMAAMTKLVFGTYKHVRLSAYSASSKNGTRLLRYVDVDRHLGVGEEWHDVQSELLQGGYVWWKTELVETAHNADYVYDTDVAMKAGRVLFNPNYHYGACKEGPSQSTPLKMWIQWNGYDPLQMRSELNREYVRIENGSATNLSVAGWTVRDTSHDPMFVFPKGSVIPAKSSVIVRRGTGTRSGTTYYWPSTGVNTFRDARLGESIGDSAYLLDPDGDVRTWMVYPCVRSCTDPLKGKLLISKVMWNPAGDESTKPNTEYVDLKLAPSVTTTQNIGRYSVERYPYNVVIPYGTKLAPGQTLRVKMGTGNAALLSAPSTMSLYIGADHSILTNGGDIVVLRTWDAKLLDCVAWGTKKCPSNGTWAP